MPTLLGAYLHDETGAAALEYALILSIVGTGIGLSALAFGQTLANLFAHLDQCLKNPVSC